MSTDLEAMDESISADAPAESGVSASGHRDARSFAKNSAMLSGMGLMVSGLGLIYRIYIAKYFGDTGYGTYVFITTFVAYFGVISLFGFRNVIIRQVARAKDQASEYVQVGLQLRLLSGALAFALALVLALTLKRTEHVQSLVIVCALSLPVIGLSDILDAVFLGKEKSEYSAISAAIANILKVVIGITLLKLGFGIISVLMLFVGTSLLNLVLNWGFLRYKMGIVLVKGTQGLSDVRKYVFKEAIPFVWISMLSKIYYKNDILILGWLKGDRVVGWYGGAYMAVDMLLLVGWALVNASFPIISRAHVSEPDRVARYYEILNKYLFMIFAPICLFVSAFGGKLLPAVLGKGFVKGIDALAVLIWMVLFETLTCIAGSVMGATGHQRILAFVSAFNAVFMLVLTLSLVPKYSYMGAAWATTVGAIVNFVVASCMVKRISPQANLPKTLWRPIVAAVMMGVVTFGLGPQYRIPSFAAGLLVYATMLSLMRVIGSEDKAMFGSLLGSVLKRR